MNSAIWRLCFQPLIGYQRPVLAGLHHRHSARLLQGNVKQRKREADDSIEKNWVFFPSQTEQWSHCV
jgi:hypothetical protein